jgi:hypothetical protein
LLKGEEGRGWKGEGGEDGCPLLRKEGEARVLTREQEGKEEEGGTSVTREQEGRRRREARVLTREQEGKEEEGEEDIE